MAVNVKMGVDIGSFTSGIRQGQQILKGLNAEMKASEAEFKATGNAEQKLTQQTRTLNSQMNVQKGIADQAKNALKAMTDAGVNPADAAYQKLYVTMLNAEAGANEAQAALNNLGQGAEQAAQGADNLTKSVNGISKKISLDQVIGGIDKITSGLENAAKKAVHLGEEIWNSVMDSARWADDTATMAQMYGIDLDTFQRMQKLVTNGLDTSVEAILKAQKKMRKGIGEESKGVMETLEQLGLAFSSGKDDATHLITEDQTELFWEAGQALMNMSDAYDKEAAAQTLFGRSWEELVPLFSQFKTVEEYNAALAEQNVVSEESVNNLAELNDKYSELMGNFQTLKTEVMGQLAPALTTAAEALNGVLQSVLDYLKTPEGQKALEDLSTAVSGLFDDLGKIDPQQVVSGFTEVFNKIVSGVEWIVANKDAVVHAMEGIVIGWGALKLTGGALEILKLINGLKDFLNGGAASAASGATGGGGTFMTAVSNALANVLPGISSWVSVNGGPVADWLTHESPLASVLSGRESLGDWWSRMQAEQQERSETFAANWDPTSETANVLAQAFGKVLGKEVPQTQPATNSAGLTDEQIHNMQLFYQTYREITEKGPAGVNEATLDYYSKAGNLLKDLFAGNEDQLAAYMLKMKEAAANGVELLDESFFNIGENGVEVPIDPKPPENEAEVIANDVGTVVLDGKISIKGITLVGNELKLPEHANGIFSVPTDNYLAYLHKGERVMPAREVTSRNYSSNLYVESMYMNNGTDAAGLAAAMAAAQRRTLSGYGS